jgi:hypothetical protein
VRPATYVTRINKPPFVIEALTPPEQVRDSNHGCNKFLVGTNAGSTAPVLLKQGTETKSTETGSLAEAGESRVTEVLQVVSEPVYPALKQMSSCDTMQDIPYTIDHKLQV